MKKLFENLYQIFLIATNEPFLFNFFSYSQKKKKEKKLLQYIRNSSEYLTHFTVYRMFALHNLMSTIMKALAYCMRKIIAVDSGMITVHDPKIYFAKDILSDFAPGYAKFLKTHRKKPVSESLF